MRFLISILFVLASLRGQAQQLVLSSGQLTSAQIIAATPPVTAPTPDILWWKLAAGSGTTLADSSTGGTHSGTIASASQWQSAPTGYSGYSLTNNGSSWYEESSGTIAYGTNKITVCFWLWIPSGESSTAILLESSVNYSSQNGAWAIYISGSGQFTAALALGGTLTHYPYTPGSFYNAWHQYTILIDMSVAGGAFTVYQDGAAVTQGSGVNGGGAAQNLATQTLYGMARAASSLWCYGGIDDIRIYSGDQTAYASRFYSAGPGTL